MSEEIKYQKSLYINVKNFLKLIKTTNINETYLQPKRKIQQELLKEPSRHYLL